MGAPKLRVFAGPNGSGKSTIKDQIPSRLISLYVNADELEKAANQNGLIDLSEFGFDPSEYDLRSFVAQHPLIVRAGLGEDAHRLVLNERKIDLRAVAVNSYHAAFIAALCATSCSSRR